MKIVVLCGGLSTERDISIITGTRVCQALRENGHKAVLVDLFLGLDSFDGNCDKYFDNLEEMKSAEFAGNPPSLEEIKMLRKDGTGTVVGPGVIEICKDAEIVFIALHGKNGEDGRIQALFDLMGIAYTGSGYLEAAIAMDKILTKKLVKEAGIRTPVWKEINRLDESEIKEIVKNVNYPSVVKTPKGGSSVGVYIVKSPKECESALHQCLKYDSEILIEEYIQGREFTCGVLKNKPLPSVEIVPDEKGYNYSNKYKAGATTEICPGRCTQIQEAEMEDIALKVHNLIGLSNYSRSDFILTDSGDVYFLEINTLPGLTPTSLIPQEAKAVGVSYNELCEIIVEEGMKK